MADETRARCGAQCRAWKKSPDGTRERIPTDKKCQAPVHRRDDGTFSTRCKLHGGKSTGARTPEGKARVLEACRRGAATRWRRAREAKAAKERGQQMLDQVPEEERADLFQPSGLDVDDFISALVADDDEHVKTWSVYREWEFDLESHNEQYGSYVGECWAAGLRPEPYRNFVSFVERLTQKLGPCHRPSVTEIVNRLRSLGVRQLTGFELGPVPTEQELFVEHLGHLSAATIAKVYSE